MIALRAHRPALFDDRPEHRISQLPTHATQETGILVGLFGQHTDGSDCAIFGYIKDKIHGREGVLTGISLYCQVDSAEIDSLVCISWQRYYLAK